MLTKKRAADKRVEQVLNEMKIVNNNVDLKYELLCLNIHIYLYLPIVLHLNEHEFILKKKFFLYICSHGKSLFI